MIRITIILLGISLLALTTFGGDSPATPEISPAASTRATASASATAAPSILRDCPSLQHGDKDPIDGKNCVLELQTLLQDLHYDQPTTGKFFGKTEANVIEFQRRHNIDAIGIVGPKTRAALLGDSSSSATPLPAVQQSGYSICANQQCDLYLSRTNTRRYAKLITTHPFATSVALTGIIVLACARFRLKIGSLACDGIASYITEELKHALQAAAAQNACLRITFRARITPQSPPLVFAADNSSRCKN